MTVAITSFGYSTAAISIFKVLISSLIIIDILFAESLSLYPFPPMYFAEIVWVPAVKSEDVVYDSVVVRLATHSPSTYHEMVPAVTSLLSLSTRVGFTVTVFPKSILVSERFSSANVVCLGIVTVKDPCRFPDSKAV